MGIIELMKGVGVSFARVGPSAFPRSGYIGHWPRALDST